MARYAWQGVRLQVFLRVALSGFVVVTLIVLPPRFYLPQAWLIAGVYAVFAVAGGWWLLRFGPAAARVGPWVLAVDLAALTAVTLVAAVSAYDSWTSEVLLRGLFLIPVLAATQLRPRVCAVVAGLTVAVYLLDSLLTQDANAEPLASVLMRSTMIAGIAAAAVGLCFLQRDRVRDITALLQDRTALLRDRTGLLTELAGVEQRERAELAEHLHDGALQYLLAAAQDLQEVQEDGDQQALARVQTALTESTGLLRSTVSDLHPAVLEQAGLAAAVQTLLDSAAGRARLRTKLSTQNWPSELRTAVDGLLYSSVREFVGNVVKHARASLVVVTLHRLEANAVVTVVDDGVGLDPGVLASRLAQGHIGLDARRVRLEAAGGALQFTAGPHGGTTVTVTLPLTGHA